MATAAKGTRPATHQRCAVFAGRYGCGTGGEGRMGPHTYAAVCQDAPTVQSRCDFQRYCAADVFLNDTPGMRAAVLLPRDAHTERCVKGHPHAPRTHWELSRTPSASKQLLCHCAMDTLGFEPRAFRMRSRCDATTPCAPQGCLSKHRYHQGFPPCTCRSKLV